MDLEVRKWKVGSRLDRRPFSRNFVRLDLFWKELVSPWPTMCTTSKAGRNVHPILQIFCRGGGDRHRPVSILDRESPNSL